MPIIIITGVSQRSVLVTLLFYIILFFYVGNVCAFYNANHENWFVYINVRVFINELISFFRRKHCFPKDYFFFRLYQ